MWHRLYGLDIETDTSDLTAAERAAGYSSRGLDPAITPITSIAVTGVQDAPVVLTGHEATMLADLQQLLATAAPGLLVTWNGAVFDLPFLADRARRHGVHLGLRLTPDAAIVPKYEPTPGHAGGYAASWDTVTGVPHAHLDVAYALREVTYDRGIPWGLKPAARAFGLDPIEVDRTRMHELTDAQMAAYVASDAEATADLARMLLTATLIGAPEYAE